jgi:hypothetical protein
MGFNSSATPDCQQPQNTCHFLSFRASFSVVARHNLVPARRSAIPPSRTLEDEARIRPGVFTDATILPASSLRTGPARIHLVRTCGQFDVPSLLGQ